MAEILETLMLILFGVSWPVNLLKSYRARTARGTSLLFLLLIWVGYIAGILSKLLNPSYMANIGAKWYVLAVYIFNFVMLCLNLIVYFRNRQLDLKDIDEGAEI